MHHHERHEFDRCQHRADKDRMKPVDYLRGVAALADFDDAELEDLLRASVLRPLQKGDVLFREGEPAGGMAIVLRGKIALTRAGQGGAFELATVSQGEMVGELGLLDGAPRTATATVTDLGQALVVDRQEFALLRSMGTSSAAKLQRRLCLVLCERLRKTTEAVAKASRKPAPPRPTKPNPTTRRALAAGAGLAPVSVELFRRIPLLRTLDAREAEMLLGVFKDIRVLADAVICKEGDKADSAYLVVDGEVAVYKGRDRLANIGPNSLIGQVALIDRGRRSASCVACVPTRLLMLRHDDFDQLFSARSRFAFKIVDVLASSLCAQLRIADQELSSRAHASLEAMDFSGLDDPALDEVEVVNVDSGRPTRPAKNIP